MDRDTYIKSVLMWDWKRERERESVCVWVFSGAWKAFSSKSSHRKIRLVAFSQWSPPNVNSQTTLCLFLSLTHLNISHSLTLSISTFRFAFLVRYNAILCLNCLPILNLTLVNALRYVRLFKLLCHITKCKFLVGTKVSKVFQNLT